MKTMSKRILSLLLCFAMVFSLGVPAISAEETGSNLLVNGTFDTDVSGWEIVNESTSSVGWSEYNQSFPNRGYFELNTNEAAYAAQTVAIPADGWYELSALICGSGWLELLDAEGNVLSSAFTMTQGAPETIACDAVYLEAGASVTAKLRLVKVFGNWPLRGTYRSGTEYRSAP